MVPMVSGQSGANAANNVEKEVKHEIGVAPILHLHTMVVSAMEHLKRPKVALGHFVQACMVFQRH